MSPVSLSADSPYLVVRETEPDGRGGRVDTTAVFLTASTCPIGCSMCDLHRFTFDHPTPPGAIPRQIRRALPESPGGGWIKLYNSGNFFDPRSIPPADYGEIAQLCSGFERVIVENHPRFGERRAQRFRSQLDQQQLEVAIGLETVQPRWLTRMQKQMTRDQFDQYARQLRQLEIDVRVFLIVGVPGVGVAEAIRWTRLSLRHAIRAGARHASLIPARRGNGWNEFSDPLPRLSLDDWLELQQTAIADAEGQATVTVDLWDLEPDDPKVEQLKQMNWTQGDRFNDQNLGDSDR